MVPQSSSTNNRKDRLVDNVERNRQVRKELAERVKRGALYLDEFKPGWYLEIDISKLDLSNPWNCVLGQLYGSYATGTEVLQEWIEKRKSDNDEYGMKSGFAVDEDIVSPPLDSDQCDEDNDQLYVPISEDCSETTQAYLILDRLWFSEIVARKLVQSAT